jgi:hypothetical protein
MDSDVVVWNLDARRKPELEVELELVCQPGELPGMHYARRCPELEVVIEVVVADEIVDLTAEAVLFDDDVDCSPIVDEAPHGYALAYLMASASVRFPPRAARAAAT